MRKIGSTPVKKEVVKPRVVTPPVQKDNSVAKAQIEATIALTEVAARAIDNPQLNQLIMALSQDKPEQPKTNKRLTINRGHDGLIESIDIEEI